MGCFWASVFFSPSSPVSLNEKLKKEVKKHDLHVDCGSKRQRYPQPIKTSRTGQTTSKSGAISHALLLLHA